MLKLHEKTAVIYKDEKISYRLLIQKIYSFALFIPDKTEHIAIFAENSPQWIYAFYAAWFKNSTVIPIDFMSTAEEVSYILNDCKPSLIFCSTNTESTLKSALKKVDHPITITNLNGQLIALQDINESFSFVPENPDKTAVIIYTSGTTGSPKGVMLSYTNLLENIEMVTKAKIYHSAQRMLILLPLHHIFPLLGSMIAPLYTGATVAIAPSMQADDIMKTMQDNKITMMIGVPRLYSLIRDGIMRKINEKAIARLLFSLAKKINSPTFSKKIFKQVHDKMGGAMQFMVCGGAALNDEIAKDYKALGFEILPGYGMTEAAPMISFTRPGTWKIGTAGQVMDNMEVKSTADGEIIARGKNIMKGYYKRPEETTDVLKNGWLFTGDLGFVDDKNYVHITGRRKEIIVMSNGKNINPEEIESKLQKISALITEAGVYELSDILHAIVYPNFVEMQRQGISNPDEAVKTEIIEVYNRGVAPYKQIKKFFLTKEELPRTRLGKLKRFALPGLNIQGPVLQTNEPEPDTHEYLFLKEYLTREKQTKVFPGSHLEIDLGMDSLDKVGLQTHIESAFGIEMTEENFLAHNTVKSLAEFISKNKTTSRQERFEWSTIFKEKVDLILPKSWITQNIFKNASKIFFKLYFRIRGEGQDKLPAGPVIFAPNHQSFFDGLFVSMHLKNKVFRDTFFYAKEKHVNSPIRKFLANRNNIIVVDINKDLKQSLQKLAAVLKKGKNIIIFPEGTRSANGDIGLFKKTFSILSCELNIPVVPVAINGAYRAIPKGSFFPRPWKKINVKFLEAIYPAKDETYDSLLEKVYQGIKNNVSSLRKS